MSDDDRPPTTSEAAKHAIARVLIERALKKRLISHHAGTHAAALEFAETVLTSATAVRFENFLIARYPELLATRVLSVESFTPKGDAA
jgi:hypothetical protein